MMPTGNRPSGWVFALISRFRNRAAVHKLDRLSMAQLNALIRCEKMIIQHRQRLCWNKVMARLD